MHQSLVIYKAYKTKLNSFRHVRKRGGAGSNPIPQLNRCLEEKDAEFFVAVRKKRFLPYGRGG